MTARDSIAAFRFGYGFRPGETPERPGAMLAAVAREATRAAERAPTLPEREAAYPRYVDAASGTAADRDAVRKRIQRALTADRRARLTAAAL